MRRIIFVFTLILSMLASSAYAQQQSGFGIHGVATFPLGDFGDDEGEGKDGYAKEGFGIGADYTKPIGSQGVTTWITSATFILNKCGVSNVFDAGAGDWFYILVLPGLRYQNEISSTLDIYSLAQVGINFIKPPDFLFSNGTEASYNLATSFGFTFGGGVIFENGVNIGVRYLNLDEPEVKETWEGSIIRFGFSEKQPVSIFVIVIGIPMI